MNSAEQATAVLKVLAELGICEVALCPGGRNAPLVHALDSSELFRVSCFADERSAAFFAYGRTLADRRRLVAVLTTSGTAVAELLPAFVEARYAGVPMVAITADRPASYRGTGAPQTIEQLTLLEGYADVVDVAVGEPVPTASELRSKLAKRRSVHLNVAFDEPLIEDGPGAPTRLGEGLAMDVEPSGHDALQRWADSVVRPLIIIGRLDEAERDAVREFVRRCGAVVYAEGPSGLREDTAIADQVLRSGERILRPDGPLFVDECCDGVLRIGHVPTTRLIRDLAGQLHHLPHASVSSLPFSGTPSSVHAVGSIRATLAGIDVGWWQGETARRLLDIDRARAGNLDRLFAEWPRSEAAMVRHLSLSLEPSDRVFVGNSQPIRLWDLAAAFEAPARPVGAARGANGIDGQLSTCFGWAQAGCRSIGLFGDLTTLYDLAAPWARSHADGPVHIVIMNNRGGRIFERLFSSASFVNAHELAFDGWAAMWSATYQRLETTSAPWSLASQVTELRPDAEQSDRFWDAYGRLHEADDG